MNTLATGQWPGSGVGMSEAYIGERWDQLLTMRYADAATLSLPDYEDDDDLLTLVRL